MNNWKKIFNKLILLIIFLGTLSLFTSCLGSKKITESSVKESSKIEEKKDSTSVVKVNEAIDDQITTSIADSGDKVLDAKIDEILSKINTSKSSGSNNYKFYYDKQLRELRAEIEIGKTKSQNTNIVDTKKSETSFESELDKYIKRTVVPWWLYIVGFLLVWPYIKPILFGAIKIATGPASISSVIGDFKKNNLE